MVGEERKTGMNEAARDFIERHERRLRQEYEEALRHPYIQELIESGEWDEMSHGARRSLLLDLYPCPPFFSENSRKKFEAGKLRADVARAEAKKGERV